MSAISHQVHTTRLRKSWSHIWPQAMIGFGLALTIVWVFALGRELVGLILIALSKCELVGSHFAQTFG